MAATTTAFNSLLSKLRKDYPALTYADGDEYRWSSATQTVWYNEQSADTVTLLHETAHGLLGHSRYENDIELLHLERDAWAKAALLGADYGIAISEDQIETALDTYREWLHARSLCPRCRQNGIQTSNSHYACVVCGQEWQVNDARHCGLRRRKLTA